PGVPVRPHASAAQDPESEGGAVHLPRGEHSNVTPGSEILPDPSRFQNSDCVSQMGPEEGRFKAHRPRPDDDQSCALRHARESSTGPEPPQKAAPGLRREIGGPIFMACGAGCYTALLVVEFPGRPPGRHGRARREALPAGCDRPRRLAPGTGARGDSMPKSMFVNVTAEEENRVAIVE